jgi:hypothetical protein
MLTQRRLVVIDVSGQRIGPIFMEQAVEEDFLDCFSLEDGTNTLSRNVDNYQSTLRSIPEERRSHLHRGGSLKSRTLFYLTNIISHSLPLYQLARGQVTQ